MIILIAGTSCTGKTFISQKLMEKYNIPYISIDHIKMGLIRSGNTKISVYDDESLMPYLWNIVKEIVKTAIENNQNLIIEGVYIPFDYKEYFTDMNRWTSTNTRKEQDLSHMEIDYRLNGNLRKCNSDDCLKNLASGKCKDAFVIEHIGKKFFANKYQEHTK